MNTAPWPQEIVVKPMDEVITNSDSKNKISPAAKPQPSTSLERKARPQKEQALNCPRCNSTNTKFCYYNNYSLTQPRYFCKTCRRYWTEGGSLRNIPVGGGSRKNKRPASSAFPSSNTSKIKIHEQGQDLNLGFPSTLSEFMQLPSMETHQSSALELLTSNSRGFNLMTPFMGMQIPHDPTSAFPSPVSNFTLDGLGNGGGIQGAQDGGRILFPFEHLKTTLTTSSTAAADEHHHHNHNSTDHQQGDSTGYWTGILGGAGSW